MLFRVHGGANEEVLDVVIRPPKSKERIRRLQRMIRRLRELTNYNNIRMDMDMKALCKTYPVQRRGCLSYRE